PNGGVGYGALRAYTAPDPSQQPLVSPAEVSFNYLGQLKIDTTGFITELVTEPVRNVKSEGGDRAYLLEIIVFLQSNQLQIRLRYSHQQYEQSTIQQLAQGFSNNLQSLIAHCSQPNKTPVASPKFSAAQVEAGQLNRLMGKLQARGGRS
ncbi:MAG: condensation domain-containing protein, partial [Phormidesmis sp.]